MSEVQASGYKFGFYTDLEKNRNAYATIIYGMIANNVKRQMLSKCKNDSINDAKTITKIKALIGII